MTAEKLVALTKDTAIPISFALLIALIAGIWALAYRVHSWENRLKDIETGIQLGWSYHMEREAWKDFQRMNPTLKIPDVISIRRSYHFP